MSIGKNLRDIGKINIESLVKLLILEKGLSRRELAERLGLSKMTISNIVNHLKEMGYLQEHKIERLAPGSGPVPTIVSIVPKTLATIGVHISSTTITVQEVDIVDGVLYERQHPVDSIEANKQLVRTTKRMIEELLYAQKDNAPNILGIGVTYSGMVDATKGKISFSANQIEKEEVNIRSQLSRAFTLPVYVGNEIEGAMIAELVFGAMIETENVYYVNMGRRIRGGFINNYRVLYGTYGLAGEVGHMTVKYDGPLCLCGSRGCYNLYAGLSVLLENSKCHSVEELQLKLQEREPLALRIMEEYIQITVSVFTNIVNLYDPNAILIGGELARLDVSIFRKIERLLNERILFRKNRYIKILVSDIHRKVNPIGAAMVAYHEIFRWK